MPPPCETSRCPFTLAVCQPKPYSASCPSLSRVGVHIWSRVDWLEQAPFGERGVPLHQVIDGRDQHARRERLGRADVFPVPQLLAVPLVALRRSGMMARRSFTRVRVMPSGLKMRSSMNSPYCLPVTFSMSIPSRK